MAARREQFVNDAQTTLSAVISDGTTTSVTVTDGSVFPATGDFRVIVENEVMTVTARSTNTLTVVRGVDGTTGVSHASGSTIRAILSAGGLNQVLTDISGGWRYRPPCRILNQSNVTLTSSSFSWTNQGTATVGDTSAGQIYMTLPNATGHNMRILDMDAPSTPWTLSALVLAGPGYVTGTTGSHMGICCRESSTGKLYSVTFRMGDTSWASRWTDYNSFSAYVGSSQKFVADRLWLQIEDNGTNVYFRNSADGINWFELGTEGRTAYMAATGPNKVGFYGSNYNASAGQLVHIQSWVLT